MLTILDLFSGIGGFSLGLERTGGFRTVAFCETDDYCRKVLAKHWPNTLIYGDVRELSGEQLRQDGIAADVITGGFPCQDISVAGKRAGLDGERSGLWKEYARIIGEIQPRYAIVENVPNLLAGPSEQRGGWFGQILGDLAEIGYDAEWHCIQAYRFGAPHERDRVWIVAYPENDARVHQSNNQKITERLFNNGNHWRTHPWAEANPRICHMDDGIPNRVVITSALGNAVVPQVVEVIGRAILEAESDMRRAA